MNYVSKGQNTDEMVDNARTSLEKMKILYDPDSVTSFEKIMNKIYIERYGRATVLTSF